ncbi:hypothetical protein C5S35_15365 [Candidatus Methanophagaceae archaeon]|nr:hypothetical protein C5S35_15365 [Methanophagales archaeon]
MNDGKKGIVDIDIYKSALLKQGKSQKPVEVILGAYHSMVEKIFAVFDGKCWHKTLERRIFLFPTPNDAIDASLLLLDNLTTFDTKKNQLSFPLFVRIGVHEIEIENMTDVPESERGKFAQGSLDIVGVLQQNCPIGKIAVSREVIEKIKGIKLDIFRPTLTPELSKMRAFVLRRQPFMSHEEFLLYGLHNEQKLSIPAIPFTTWNNIVPDENINLATLDEILEQPLLVILGESSSYPQSPISSAATSDAIGIIEIMAELSNVEVTVGIDQWEDTADLVSDHNILLVGSSIVNTYAFALNDIIKPVHFVKAEGRVFDKIVVTSQEGEKYFGPHTLSPRDCGIVTISKSPFNLDKTLIWIGGITGIGTHAATIFMRELIHDPQSVLWQRTTKNIIHPIGCVVSASKDKGSCGSNRLRIRGYKILWMVDREGKTFEHRRHQKKQEAI